MIQALRDAPALSVLAAARQAGLDPRRRRSDRAVARRVERHRATCAGFRAALRELAPSAEADLRELAARPAAHSDKPVHTSRYAHLIRE